MSAQHTMAAARMSRLASVGDEMLAVLAEELDLPIEDAESPDFVRQALVRAAKRVRVAQAEERLQSLKEDSHE